MHVKIFVNVIARWGGGGGGREGGGKGMATGKSHEVKLRAI